MASQFDYLSKRFVYTPEKEALFDVKSNKRFTYAELNAGANQVANYLQQKHNFSKGDRCAVLAFNDYRYWLVFFGVQKLGGIIVGLNWRLVPAELNQLTKDVSPKVFFYDKNTKKIVNELKNLYKDTNYNEFDEIFEKSIKNYSMTNPKHPKLTYEDPIGIVFTGGTTGLPKGAMISYRQVAYNTLNTIRDILPGDTYINHLPLFHVGGLYVYALPLFILGGKVIQMEAWNPELYLQLITSERPTFGFCVPTQYRMLLARPEFSKVDFSTHRFLTSGGEPLSLDIIRSFKEIHNIVFKQGFGMTEVGPGVFALDPKDAERKIGSIGTPNFFLDAKIINPETGQECKSNEIGELVLKGPTVTIGYWNRPEINRILFDPEGYFHTGDMAKKDEEGYFFIVDRLKDMYISGGENIYPREIEKVLEEHPSVAQVQVIPIKDEKWGQSGRALVVLKTSSKATEEELINFCKERLAKFKIPKSIVFVDGFTNYISAAGKILKRKLAEDYGK